MVMVGRLGASPLDGSAASGFGLSSSLILSGGAWSSADELWTPLTVGGAAVWSLWARLELLKIVTPSIP